MSYYPQEPQRQETPNPYEPHNPYSSQQSYTSPSSQQSYTSPSPQQPYTNNPESGQGKVRPGNDASFFVQLWSVLTQFLGRRGLLATTGAVLAILAFFMMPYYSNYSGYFLAAETLDDKWWLELALAIIPLLILLAQRFVPRMQQLKRRWSLVMLGSGLLGLLINYWFMNMMIGSSYWRFGTWVYFVGMALVSLAGLLLSLL